eukprot:1156686-Pelagomonas_calceolata.AAC.2
MRFIPCIANARHQWHARSEASCATAVHGALRRLRRLGAALCAWGGKPPWAAFHAMPTGTVLLGGSKFDI